MSSKLARKEILARWSKREHDYFVMLCGLVVVIFQFAMPNFHQSLCLYPKFLKETPRYSVEMIEYVYGISFKTI
jgi:hypothetical protein